MAVHIGIGGEGGWGISLMHILLHALLLYTVTCTLTIHCYISAIRRLFVEVFMLTCSTM